MNKEINGKTYTIPTRNLLEFGIIEYFMWIGICILYFIITGKFDYLRYDFFYVPTFIKYYPLGTFLIYIVSPICAYKGVLTRVLLLRNENIIKWNNRIKYVEINGETYEKPFKNLIGFGIIEYIAWFFIGLLLAIIIGNTIYKQLPVYLSPVFILFVIWFIIGPICSFFGVITRPLLMKEKSILKWNNRRTKNYKQYIEQVICPNCGRPIPQDSKFCAFCGVEITEDELKKQKTQINENINEILRQKYLKHIVLGGFWFFLGIIVYFMTMNSNSPVVVVMYGAIILGFIEMIYGLFKYLT